MYLFANILLLALFAGGVFSLVPVVRKKVSLQDWWHTESYLFGSWGADFREKAGWIFFYIGLGIYEFTALFCYSTISRLYTDLISDITFYLFAVAAVCLVIKAVLGTRYSARSLLFAGALYFIARWVYSNSQYIWWIWVVFFILAFKDTSLTRSMQVLLAVGIPTFLLMTGLWLAGLIPDLSNGNRLAFGTPHQNVASGIVLGFLLAWLLIRRNRLGWVDVLLTGLFAAFAMFVTHSRTAVGAALLLAVMLLLVKLRGEKLRPANRPLAGLLAATVPAVCGISLYLPQVFHKPNSLFYPYIGKLDSLLTGRLGLTANAMDYYPLKIAGQFLDRNEAWDLYLDNTYALLLYAVGPVMLTIVCALVTYAIYRYARMGRWVEVCCLVAMVAYSYAENQVLRFQDAPLNLLLTGAVFALPPQLWNREPNLKTK